MSFEGLLPVTDPDVGAWIAPRLRGFGGRVGCVVPQGYEAYARVLHAPEINAAPRAGLTWGDVCKATGAVPHALMQWRSISHAAGAGSVDAGRDAAWDGPEPEEGNLPSSALAELIAVLAPFTGEQDCFFAVWEGWGWVDGAGTALVIATTDPDAPRAPVAGQAPGVPAAALQAPRLRHPGRDYLLFRGSLELALRIGQQVTPDWFLPQSPSLLWPEDRTWCIATEIDFDSTLVGGPAALVEAVLQSGLEVWPVQPEDDLSYSGDRINGMRARP